MSQRLLRVRALAGKSKLLDKTLTSLNGVGMRDVWKTKHENKIRRHNGIVFKVSVVMCLSPVN